jgi:hypothetical protein
MLCVCRFDYRPACVCAGVGGSADCGNQSPRKARKERAGECLLTHGLHGLWSERAIDQPELAEKQRRQWIMFKRARKGAEELRKSCG